MPIDLDSLNETVHGFVEYNKESLLKQEKHHMTKKEIQMAEYVQEVNAAKSNCGADIKITLTRNKTAIVSGCDIEFLQSHGWCAVKKNGKWYAARGLSDGTTIYMHREIAKRMGIESDYIDHIDRNGLNNSRSNLRAATASQNIANAGMFNTNTSGYRGVTYDKERGCYKAAIKFKKKYKFIGRFSNPAEAALAYNNAAKILFGEFAFHNNVIDTTEIAI